jgi:hypothetical protein
MHVDVPGSTRSWLCAHDVSVSVEQPPAESRRIEYPRPARNHTGANEKANREAVAGTVNVSRAMT